MTLQGPSFGAVPQRRPQLLGGVDGINETIGAHPFLTLLGLVGGAYVTYRVFVKEPKTISGLAGKVSRDAKACIADEISRHCKDKPGHCRDERERKQAIAIGFSICKRRGFRSIPKAPRR